MTLPAMRPTAGILCCGAGIAHYGIEKHFQSKFAVDINRQALETHEYNHPDVPVICRDISDPSAMRQAREIVNHVDVIINASPCQLFAICNSACKEQRLSNKLSQLYVSAIDWVAEFRPLAYIAENVPGVKKSWQYHGAIAKLRRLGYRVTVFDLDAADFGVPQHRERVFLVAIRACVPLPKPPFFSHGDPVMRAENPNLLPYLTIHDAIYDLYERELKALAKRRHDEFLREEMLGIEKLSAKRAYYLSYVPPGGTWKDLPVQVKAELLDDLHKKGKAPFEGMASRFAWLSVPGTLRTGPSIVCRSMPIHPGMQLHRRDWNWTPGTLLTGPDKMDEMTHPGYPASSEKMLQRAGFWMRRPHWQQPSCTLPSNPNGDKAALITPGTCKNKRATNNAYGSPGLAFVRYETLPGSVTNVPIITRYLTVREYARIMGLPDTFVPLGTVSDRYRQIGNGIPPALMSAVCNVIAQAITAGEDGPPSLACSEPESPSPDSGTGAKCDGIAGGNSPAGEMTTLSQTVEAAATPSSAAICRPISPSFAHIFDRNHQIAIVNSVIDAAIRSNFAHRFHVVLHGPPACGKTEIMRTFAAGFGDQKTLWLDGTSTTHEGAEDYLLSMLNLPEYIFVEEIEKAGAQSVRWLLSVLDQRAEIVKTTAGSGRRRRTVRALCIATVNDMRRFESMLSGALSSRFAHKIYCPRPSRSVIEQILKREVSKIAGNPAWIMPAINYCQNVERTDDPRRIISICLSARDALLTGEYMAHLKATSGPHLRRA
jgi:site-specific DNA-cytosine methylase